MADKKSQEESLPEMVCPHCEKAIDRVDLIRGNVRPFAVAVYVCPLCRKVLSISHFYR